ncbi:MAG: phosphodiester glycosidase family protein [Saccharofermentans sp.]|nr:phosphodiester glycosidase family protein [Saccharofermentans sp.]
MKNKVLRTILKTLGFFFLFIITTLTIVIVGAWGALRLAFDGPSPKFREMFVTSMMESSAGPIVIRWFLPEEEIQAIVSQNQVMEFDEITDPSLVTIMHREAEDKAEAAQNANQQVAVEESLDPDGDGIEVHEISGPMYHGYLMIVYDPSRVICGTINNYSQEGGGMTLESLIEKYGGVAGINGGRYEDEGGLGMGGFPIGLVFSQGSLRHVGHPKILDEETGEYIDDPDPQETTFTFCGFNRDDVLVVGTMSPEYAQGIGIRDGVSFGPALIINGEPAVYNGAGGGLNPRSAIGQRSDGAVILLCIEGRKTSSMGATMADLIDIMLEYGAVNAYNLDGGMSSSMYLNGEEIVDNANVRSDRAIPTAWVVLPPKDQEG